MYEVDIFPTYPHLIEFDMDHRVLIIAGSDSSGGAYVLRPGPSTVQFDCYPHPATVDPYLIWYDMTTHDSQLTTTVAQRP